MHGNSLRYEQRKRQRKWQQHGCHSGEYGYAVCGEGHLCTDNMGDTNGNGNTVSENDSLLDNAGNAVDEAGDTVGNIVDDAANGISDITNDLVGNDNTTTGTNQQ